MHNMDGFLQEVIHLKNKVTFATCEYLERGGHFGEFEKAVKDHIKEGARIVIFGHTHRPQLQIIDDAIYANCGSWVDGSLPTYITFDKDRIELKEACTSKLLKRLLLK